MHTLRHLFVLLMAIATATTLSAQPRHPMPDRHARPERLEKFKTMRLVEILKLDEETAVRFYAKQNAHEDKFHELMKSRNDAIDRLADISNDGKDTADVGKTCARVLDLDQQMFAERQRYQEEMRGFLSPAQFAKFLIFERNFGRNVHEAMRDMRKNRED